jgi:uncharacterized repeat protein (TIGR01451 family)
MKSIFNYAVASIVALSLLVGFRYPINVTSMDMQTKKKSADLMVKDLEVVDQGDFLELVAKVRNNGNDDARKAMCIVQLPVGIQVISFSSTGVNMGGYIQYKLGTIAAANGLPDNEQNTKTVKVKVRKNSDLPREEAFSVFAYSIIPDGCYTNNYAYWADDVNQCRDGSISNTNVPSTGDYDFGDGFDWELPICSRPTCRLPIEVPEICKRVINCPGCGLNTLCKGNYIFEGLDFADVIIEDNGKVILTSKLIGNNRMIQVDKDITSKNWKFVFTSNKLSNVTKFKVRYEKL